MTTELIPGSTLDLGRQMLEQMASDEQDIARIPVDDHRNPAWLLGYGLIGGNDRYDFSTVALEEGKRYYFSVSAPDIEEPLLAVLN